MRQPAPKRRVINRFDSTRLDSTRLESINESLLAAVRATGPAAIAFSGGVDSVLLAAAYVRAGIPAVAIHVALPLQPAAECDRVPETARLLGIPFKQKKLPLKALPFLADHPVDRCYQCKRVILHAITQAATAAGFTTLCDGTHAGDLAEDRPGLRALREAGVHSPLRDARLTKPEILALAKSWKLPFAGRVSSACLATRIPFGTPVTAQRLAAVEKAEDALLALGFKNPRVRHHGAIARIELPPAELPRAVRPQTRAAILDALRPLGFRFITLDLAGYKTGGINF